MQKYVVLEKAVGQTPLECMEAWRINELQKSISSRPGLELVAATPLTYAGRLDPMASGKLLVLIGEECKQKEHYNALDKEYRFQVLFGISTDSGDVLGLPTFDKSQNVDVCSRPGLELALSNLKTISRSFLGSIELPYPHYSSKTVSGKPLHTWTLEGRLDEINIPTRRSTIYKLTPTDIQPVSMADVHQYVQEKIATIAPVTDARKSLGNDFRRPLIRPAWEKLAAKYIEQTLYLADFTCIASSGTYMRTLAQEISKAASTTGLAYSIHRTTIGRYQPLAFRGGFWQKRYL